MMMLFVVLIVLVVNSVSATLNHINNQPLERRAVSSHLRQRNVDPDLSSDSFMVLLLPRAAFPGSPPGKSKNRPASRPGDQNPDQSTSTKPLASSSANQASSKEPLSKASRKAKKESKETPIQESRNAQQHANTPSHANTGQTRQPIEVAQANIARGRENIDKQDRPSSPLNLPSAVDALADDAKKKLSLVRFSHLDLKAIDSEHDAWMQGAMTNIARAEINAKTKAMAGLRDARRPGRIYNQLKEARSAVKQTRNQAKARIEAAVDAYHTRPLSSPTTRVRFAQAEAALDKAQGVSAAYYNREYQASLAASGESRWSDYPAHVKKAYKANTRHSAMESYHHGVLAEYQSRLDDQALSALKADDPKRGEAVKVAVESRKDFHAAARLYYMRDRQYHDARNKWPEGMSSEDESKEFDTFPRNRRTP